MPGDVTVLVVEDESSLREAITMYLGGEGFSVISSGLGEEALQLFFEEKPDIVLLDVMLPDIDGFAVCKRIREVSDIPVMFLTALTDDDSQILGYRTGADDYIGKPFRLSILVLKMRRMLSRYAHSREKENGLTLDPEGTVCYVDGQDANLTYREFAVLSELVANSGRTLSREYLLMNVWGYNYYGESRVVDNHIKNLRRKLGPYGERIRTVVSVGYKYEDKP